MGAGSAEFYVGEPGRPTVVVVSCPAWGGATPQHMQGMLETLRKYVEISRAEVLEGAKVRVCAPDDTCYNNAYDARTFAQWVLRALRVEASQILNVTTAE